MRLNYKTLFLTSLLFASCSARSSIPVGEIPKPAKLSNTDRTEAAKMLAEVTSKFPVSTNTVQIDRVTRVLKPMLEAAGANSAEWSIMILENDSIINAGATRGNQLFVWSGLLKFVQTDGELATILGHELGHLLAQHPKKDLLETLSNGLAKGTGGIANSALSDRTPSYSSNGNDALGKLVVGVVFGLTSLAIQKSMVEPESRRKELEADTIGLFLMKKAGYDPYAAVALWGRFAQLEKVGNSGFSLGGSHPTSKNRLKNIKKIVEKLAKPNEVATAS